MSNKKVKPIEFNYAIGRYWKADSGTIAVYTYGSEVHCGNLDQAKSLLKMIQEKADNKKYTDGKKIYKIFQLVEVPT
jgi:hypothetical protein